MAERLCSRRGGTLLIAHVRIASLLGVTALALLLAIAPLPAPFSVQAAGGDRFGVHLNVNYQDVRQTVGAMGVAGQVGIGWVRFGMYWSRLEPSAGQYSWATTDALVAGARGAGLQVLAQLGFSSDWGTSAPAAVQQRGKRVL